MDAALAVQLEQIFLAWLTEHEPVQREVILEKLVARPVTAERAQGELANDTAVARCHPVWLQPSVVGAAA